MIEVFTQITCDRCKKTHKIEGKFVGSGDPVSGWSAIYEYDLEWLKAPGGGGEITANAKTAKTVELCPECTKQLKEWFHWHGSTAI